MAEQLFNLFAANLAADYTAGDGSINLTTSTGLPASGTYTLVIRDSITGAVKLLYRVASRSGTVCTGAAETSDVNCSTADPVSGAGLSAASVAALVIGRLFSGVVDPNGALAIFSPDNMTGYSSPSPYSVSADSNTYGESWKCFDGNNSTYWGPFNGGLSFWIKIDFGAGASRILDTYILRATNSGQEGYMSPKTWIMEGSNDNSSWTTIDAVTGAPGWSSGEERTYVCDTRTTVYRYYRLAIDRVSNDNYYGELAGIRFYYYSDPFNEGNDGDFYIDTTALKLYGPKSGSSWPLIGSLNA